MSDGPGSVVNADELIRYVAWATNGAVVLTRGTLRVWVHRGHISKPGREPGGHGRSLYDVRSVVDYLRSTGIVFDTPDEPFSAS